MIYTILKRIEAWVLDTKRRQMDSEIHYYCTCSRTGVPSQIA